MGEGLMTYDDLAKLLRVSVRQAKRIAARNGRALGKIEMGHRTVRFRPASVQAWIAQKGGAL